MIKWWTFAVKKVASLERGGQYTSCQPDGRTRFSSTSLVNSVATLIIPAATVHTVLFVFTGTTSPLPRHLVRDHLHYAAVCFVAYFLLGIEWTDFDKFLRLICPPYNNADCVVNRVPYLPCYRYRLTNLGCARSEFGYDSSHTGCMLYKKSPKIVNFPRRPDTRCIP